MPRSALGCRLALKPSEVADDICRQVDDRPRSGRSISFLPQQTLAASSTERPDISDAICRRNPAGLTGLLNTS